MRLLHAAVLASSTMVPLACAAILGDDFDIVDTGSGNGGAGAGVSAGGNAGPGGTGGVGGEEPAPYYNCDWDSPEHRLVRSLEATPMESFGNPFSARRGPDSVRGVVTRSEFGDGFFDIYTLDSSLNVGTASYPATQVHQVVRTSTVNMGVLYTKLNTAGLPELRLLVVADSSPDGANGNDVLLATTSTLPNFDVSFPSMVATMATVPLGGLDDFDVDVVVSYQNTLGDFAIHYARYERAPLPTFVRITDPALNLSENDTYPRGIAHFGGTTYAYFGDTGGVLGLTVYALDDSVTGFVTGTPIGQGEQLGPIEVVPPDYANVCMVSLVDNIQFLTGAVAGADLGSLDPADLIVAAEFQSLLDLPVFEVTAYWHEDIFTMIGPDADNSVDMAYYFLDNEGRERGLGSLDFTLQLPAEEERDRIGNLTSTLRGDPLGARGGTLHVLWTETHIRNSQPFDVLYYDRLRCTPE